MHPVKYRRIYAIARRGSLEDLGEEF